MTNEEIYQSISTTLQELFEVSADQISPTTRLYQDLDLDSIDAVDLIVKLQDITNEKISPEVFKGVRTVNDVVLAVEKLLDE